MLLDVTNQVAPHQPIPFHEMLPKQNGVLQHFVGICCCQYQHFADRVLRDHTNKIAPLLISSTK